MTVSSPRTGRRHDRAAVVETALRLLDEYGLPDLTMRRLATELDVQPSALYWHVENKQSLLAAVADRIQAAARPSPPTQLGWRDATAIEASALRDAMLAFRDGAEVVLSTRALGLGSDAAHRRLAAAIGRGHDPRTAQLVATSLLHFIFGDAALVQQRMQADALGVTGESVALHPDGEHREDEAFRMGIELLLSGLDQLARV